jgi:predicted nucleic acid-binding protein
MTGYQTDLLGEFEISAWELASGCADKTAAWILNFGGYAAGLLVAPRRTLRAFVRGRHSQNLYRRRYDDALLARTVGEMRRELGLDGAARASVGDLLLAAIAWVVGITVGLLLFAVTLPLAPIGYVVLRSLRK